MNSHLNWEKLLAKPNPGDHIVQLYRDDAFLKDAVSQYISTGLHRGQGVIVIATPPHIQAFQQQLEADGFNVNEAIENGQLTILDAELTLSKFMRNDMPDLDAFLKTVGRVMAEVCARYETVCAYGEMVDILWQRGAREAAVSLEEYWNLLSKLHSFSLLCAYFIDHLNDEICGEPFKRVCQHHSHIIPTRDYNRLEHAVTKASNEVLSPPLANMLQKLAMTYSLSTRMPPAQATLMYLRETMPRTANKVFSRVRALCEPTPQENS